MSFSRSGNKCTSYSISDHLISPEELDSPLSTLPKRKQFIRVSVTTNLIIQIACDADFIRVTHCQRVHAQHMSSLHDSALSMYFALNCVQ